jgi:hypothetical protein
VQWGKMKNKIFIFFKKNLFWVKLIFAVILIFLLFYKIDIAQSFSLFSEINLLVLIPLVLYIPALILTTFRWKIILDKKINFYSLFKINWISNFFSNFLPSTIGGDSYKVVKLRKVFGIKRVTTSVVFDRFSGIFSLIILSVVFSTFFYPMINNKIVAVLPFILFFLVFFSYIVVIKIKLKSLFFSSFQEAIKTFRKKLFSTTLISIVFQFLGALSLWIYYYMFGFNLNFFVVFIFYNLIQLISFIPISLNAIGLREGATVYFFSTMGVPPEISLAIGILSRLVMIIQTAVGGIFYMAEKSD